MQTLALIAALAFTAAPKAAGKTQLKLDVKPESAVVYVDGKKRGTGAKEIVLSVDPGRHTLKIVNKGDEHEEVVVVKKGETKRWAWAFEDDRMDRKAEAAESEPGSGGSGDAEEVVP